MFQVWAAQGSICHQHEFASQECHQSPAQSACHNQYGRRHHTHPAPTEQVALRCHCTYLWMLAAELGAERDFPN